MKPMVLGGIVLCILGSLALAYGGFTWTHREKIVDIGPIQATAEKSDFVVLPPLLGLVGLLAGVGLVLVGSSRT